MNGCAVFTGNSALQGNGRGRSAIEAIANGRVSLAIGAIAKSHVSSAIRAAANGQPPELQRGNALHPLKGPAVITGIMEAAGIGDFRNGLPGIGKQRQAFFNSAGKYVPEGGNG